MNTKSRNKNLLSHIKSVDGKLNGITISNWKNNNHNEILFHTTMNQNKRNYLINNTNTFNNNISSINNNIKYIKKRVNDYNNGKYQYKNLIYNKLNPKKFSSGENIFNNNIHITNNHNNNHHNQFHNFEYYKNLNLYK